MPLVRLTVTPAKLAANRANGRKSRGPRTCRGKGFVTLNALKHGRSADPKLFRTHLLCAGQDVTLYDWFYHQICDFLPPVNRAEWVDRERLARKSYCWFRGTAKSPGAPGSAPSAGWPALAPSDPRNRGFLGPEDWLQGTRKYALRSKVYCQVKIAAALRGGKSNPPCAVKSTDTYLPSPSQLQIGVPGTGFELTFWVRRRPFRMQAGRRGEVWPHVEELLARVAARQPADEAPPGVVAAGPEPGRPPTPALGIAGGSAGTLKPRQAERPRANWSEHSTR